MRVGQSWWDTYGNPLEPQRAFEFDTDLFLLLFASWGVGAGRFVPLALNLEFREGATTGRYLPWPDGLTHSVVLPFKLLDDPEEFNRTVVHELRHLWWRLKTGKNDCPVPTSWQRGEEADCRKAEGIHAGLRLLRPPRPSPQQLEWFFLM